MSDVFLAISIVTVVAPGAPELLDIVIQLSLTFVDQLMLDSILAFIEVALELKLNDVLSTLITPIPNSCSIVIFFDNVRSLFDISTYPVREF
jgi:hypothetical protein